MGCRGCIIDHRGCIIVTRAVLEILKWATRARGCFIGDRRRIIAVRGGIIDHMGLHYSRQGSHCALHLLSATRAKWYATSVKMKSLFISLVSSFKICPGG